MTQSSRDPQSIVLTGATSPVARALAELFARDGWRVVLAGRNREELERTAADLRIRFGVMVHVVDFEATALDRHEAFWAACLDACQGKIEACIACHGLLIDQAEAERDPALAVRLIEVNYTSVVSILERAAAHMAERRSGTIAAISSVAGDRGRKSNYLYGAPKAGLSTYLEGLRYRLWPAGVHVLTIKPGFIDTPMTWGKVNPRLAASPARVARDIHRALQRRRGVIYTPWPWRWVILIIRNIPTIIFRRMKI